MRRRLAGIVVTCAALIACAAAPAQAAKSCAEPRASWERATPGEAGMDAARLLRGTAAVEAGLRVASFLLLLAGASVAVLAAVITLMYTAGLAAYAGMRAEVSAASRAGIGAVPPSNRPATAAALTEKRTRVRPPCGNDSNGPTPSYLVVKRSCTGLAHARVPKCSIVAASDPVRCSMPSGSV